MSEITFERAIEQSQAILAGSDDLNPERAGIIKNLVATEAGARGFFVVYLSGEEPEPEGLLEILKTSPDIVGDILVKNLAMSTAMEVYHRRAGDGESASGSRGVREKTIALIERLSLPEISEKLAELEGTISETSDRYSDFLRRWGYDREQKEAILKTIQARYPR